MGWFFSAGDGPFFFNEQMRALSWLPQVIDPAKGFGELVLPRLWLEYPFHLLIKILSYLGLSWFFIDKLVWLVPLAVGMFASYRLSRFFFKSGLLPIVSMVIYMTNTYALMLFGGGQLGLWWAYCLTPAALSAFFDTRTSVAAGIKRGILFAFLAACDVRIAFLIFGIIIFYHLFFHEKWRREKFISYGVIPAVLVFFVHAYWILPTVFGEKIVSALSDVYTGSGMVSFLSFADFSHALSLLHPNWPENLFGKVYFQKPEFLLLPAIAFAALGFIKKKKNVVFFSFLSLAGVFLAKGTGDPFGGIYVWIFNYIPGFVMFRDATKFYLLIALGYAMLIPFTLEQIMNLNKLIAKKALFVSAVFLFIAYWSFTVRPLWMGQLAGNFQPKSIPDDYTALKNQLRNDTAFSRTLWIPKRDAFAYADANHPGLDADMVFGESSFSGLLRQFENADVTSMLNKNAVRYIVVPQDVYRRIFLDSYKFDGTIRDKLIQSLAELGFEPLPEYQDTAVFKNKDFAVSPRPTYDFPKSMLWARRGAFVSGAGILIIGAFYIIAKKKHL